MVSNQPVKTHVAGAPTALSGGKPAASVTVTRKGQTPADAAEKLRKLANVKVSRAIKAIRAVGTLGRLRPSDAQVDVMLKALQDAAEATARRLKAGPKQPVEFQLPEAS